MKRIIVALLIMMVSTIACSSAGGGMKGKPDLSPIVIDEENCAVIVVQGIDASKCIENPSSPQSGIESWICPTIFICVTDTK